MQHSLNRHKKKRQQFLFKETIYGRHFHRSHRLNSLSFRGKRIYEGHPIKNETFSIAQ